MTLPEAFYLPLQPDDAPVPLPPRPGALPAVPALRPGALDWLVDLAPGVSRQACLPDGTMLDTSAKAGAGAKLKVYGRLSRFAGSTEPLEAWGDRMLADLGRALPRAQFRIIRYARAATRETLLFQVHPKRESTPP